jgi:putative N6-adenine-specific DNA methylase
MAEFFAVVPLGWEEELATEFREIEPFLIGHDGRPSAEGLGELVTEKGGVTLRAEPLLVLQLNFFSKLASRFLVRIGNFRATEFFQLEKGLRSVELAKWLGDEQFALKAEAQKSKINNEKRILEVAEKVWGRRIGRGATQTLFIRNDKDQVTVSLDLSGEHLHRRKTGRELGGPAPLRETLAAGLVRFLIGGEPLSILQNVTLVDPMAGSGTLLSEASRLYLPSKDRSFAFQSQPWIPKLLKSPSFFANYRHLPEKTWRGLASHDEFSAARERLSELGKDLREPLEVLKTPEDFSNKAPVWVIANPPYGERLKALPPQALAKLLLSFHPERVAVILPERLALDLRKAWPAGWRVEKRSVSNGGIPCFFMRFMKNF